MRVSGFKKGGGFLNNVVGTIVDYKFTDVAPGDGKKKKAPKKGEEPFNALFVQLFVKVDGATDTVDTHLFAGSADDFTISEDGHTLEPVEPGYTLRAGTAFFRFIETLVEAGFPETNFPEEEIDFTAMIGWRVEFQQKKDEKATARLGKRKDPKTGKEYDRQELVVTKVVSAPAKGATTAAAGKATGKAAGKPAASKGGKKAAETVDASAAAAEALQRYAEKAGEAGIPIAKLRMKVLTDPTFKGNTELREAVITWLANVENLETVEGIAVDGDTVVWGN